MRPSTLFPFVLLAAACGGTSPAATDAVHEAAHLEPALLVRPGRSLDERVNGVRVLHLSGTPEEMGTQMGAACGEALRHLIDANLKKIPWVHRNVDAALAKAERHAAGIPDDQMRELRATAAAAGIDEQWLVLAATIVEVVEETRACAAVAAWDSATAGGEVIVGRNLDWFDIGGLHEHGLLVVRHPNAGRPFVSCGFPGIPGVLTGMNDAGVFVADLVQFTRKVPPSKPGAVPVMSLQRQVLETCGTAAAAAALIESASRTVPQNYIVADAHGAEFLETDADRVTRRAPERDTVAGTNWAEEKRGVLRGDVRFGNLCRSLDPVVGSVGVAEIEAALGAANSEGMSVMSVVAVPARRALRVSAGRVPACKGPFADVDAGALFAKDPR